MSLALTVRLFLSCLARSRSLAELRKKREEKWEDQTKDRRVRVCVFRVIQLIPCWRTYVEQSTFASFALCLPGPSSLPTPTWALKKASTEEDE